MEITVPIPLALARSKQLPQRGGEVWQRGLSTPRCRTHGLTRLPPTGAATAPYAEPLSRRRMRLAELLQHDEQHPTGLGGVERVGHISRHAHDGPSRSSNERPADCQVQRAIEH